MADYFWKYAKKSEFYDEITGRYRTKKEYEFKFPKRRVNKNNKIILYEYDNVGYSYFEQIIREELCELVAICDKDTERLQYASLCVPIIGISEISNYDFDYIVFHPVRIKTKNYIKLLRQSLKVL